MAESERNKKREGNLLCGNNRTRPPELEKKGVYEQLCSCSPDAKYIGQTRVNFRTRMGQHESDVTSNKSDEHISGISKHVRHCSSGTVDWTEPKILSTFEDKSKKMFQKNLLIRESLDEKLLLAMDLMILSWLLDLTHGTPFLLS